ncbi:ABC transporter, permease protein, putative xylobiose porter [Bifidobacterium coryneforme]|uniref:ABC transporter, permease protein, putative xylobiose porter n=1 Tax=Bifidobacterium coryneforme TaxID=1687 RepID=A0ABD4AG49_9BIFI|nr:carbohydrate ABC transporter permease [Bifidobacterium coryneforme]KJY54295.1 ABC transporter, permease protein, putative xylobiose porter [Bifidobacterium coryneforme]
MAGKNKSAMTPAERSYQRGRWAIYLFLVIVCLCQLLPFYLAITTSFKPSDDLSSALSMRTHDMAWSNWFEAINEGGILKSVLNSVVVTVGTTAMVCILGAAAAYPLARRLTRFNKLVSAFILSMMMIPPLSILVPLYSFLVKIGGVNNYWGIIVVLTATNLPLSVFLYTAFIKAIPPAIDEAGELDGANRLQVFIRLVLPMLKPVTATVIIMTGSTVWNDYALSSYILTDPSAQTIAPRVASFFSANTNNLGVAAAASLIAAVPMVVAYMFLQKYFIAGMVAGAVK